MNVKLIQAVTIAIGLQLVFASGTFVILMYLDLQHSFHSNLINISGKNRLLANTIQLEITRALFHDSDVHPHVDLAIANMEDNILLIKNGGVVDNIVIPRLPPMLEPEYDNLQETFILYKSEIYELLESDDKLNFANVEGTDLSSKAVIAASDSLTNDLIHYHEMADHDHILLQAIFGLLNGIVLITIVLFMWRSIKSYTTQKIRREKFESIGKLASMVAHDIRNPLGVIQNSVEIMRNTNQSPLFEVEASRISRAIQRITHQIDDVLNYVQTVPLTTKPVPITHILKKSVGMLTIPENIRINIPEDDLVVECDVEKMERVFTNIILNAVQAIGDDSGYITFKIKNDDGNDGEHYGHVIITTEDSGTPIPDEIISEVFEPMFTTKMQGTGLGLTSAKNIVELHNGTISVKNVDGRTSFTIRIPKRIKTPGGE